MLLNTVALLVIQSVCNGNYANLIPDIAHLQAKGTMAPSKFECTLLADNSAIASLAVLRRSTT